MRKLDFENGHLEGLVKGWGREMHDATFPSFALQSLIPVQRIPLSVGSEEKSVLRLVVFLAKKDNRLTAI